MANRSGLNGGDRARSAWGKTADSVKAAGRAFRDDPAGVAKTAAKETVKPVKDSYKSGGAAEAAGGLPEVAAGVAGAKGLGALKKIDLDPNGKPTPPKRQYNEEIGDARQARDRAASFTERLGYGRGAGDWTAPTPGAKTKQGKRRVMDALGHAAGRAAQYLDDLGG